MLEASEFIAGKQEGIKTFSLYLGNDIEKSTQEVYQNIEKELTNEGLLVLTDAHSDNPFNAVVGAMTDDKIRHFAGMNMPMLLIVLCQRPHMSLDKVCES